MRVKWMCIVISILFLVLPCLSNAAEAQKNDAFMNYEIAQNMPDADMLKGEQKVGDDKPSVDMFKGEQKVGDDKPSVDMLKGEQKVGDVKPSVDMFKGEQKVGDVKPSVDMFKGEQKVGDDKPSVDMFKGEQKVGDDKPSVDMFKGEQKVGDEKPSVNMFKGEQKVGDEKPSVDMFKGEQKVGDVKPSVDMFKGEQKVGDDKPSVDMIKGEQKVGNDKPSVDMFKGEQKMGDDKPDMDMLKGEQQTGEKKPFSYQNIELSLMYHYFDYKEDLSNGKSTEKGWLPGIYLGWNYNKQNAVYSKIFIEFSYGNTEYDGTTQSGTAITYSDHNPQYLFRGEWDIGYNFAVTKNVSLKPYVGYGYRRWSRGEEHITSTYASYNEIYYWHYFPVGITADIAIGDKLLIQPNAGLRFMFYGKMTAYFSELDSGFNDPSFKLGNKTGWYAEIPVTYKFSQTWAIVMKPWYEYSAIGKSDTETITYYGSTWGYAYEPSSKTNQYGVNLGIVASY
ncbi:MAG: autotransporter outer membrane beta-barrel domain-containing protein [Syntrophaceae bacterium]